MTETTVIERIQRLLRARGVDPRRIKPTLARVCGVSYQAVSQWFSGGTSNIRTEHLIAIADYFDETIDWLLLGGNTEPRGELAKKESELHDLVIGKDGTQPRPQPAPIAWRGPPVMGSAKPDRDGFFELDAAVVDEPEGFLDTITTESNAYGLRIIGNSLSPRIRNNEFLLIEPSRKCLAGDEALVKTLGGRAMIAEYIYFRDDQYRFDSINADCPAIFLGKDEVISVEYVGAIIKSSLFHPA
ncbi:TPA: helix-turn-helix transcriptional regulator [Pseudomonas aeruginosa]|uniref:XRE family transcriptional regulator n=1 Tax=Pseudomonas aeruginosa TaxID=287 RepID=UPI0009A2DC31|nr:XRE family transcriptional regulator [Pseudomonas aeruginosa]PTZ08172.1 XRE family transcriptional regulator [Pseudomonas aeruginosa]TEG22479.1 XRE family transcriptional regulator [Pseudomonas aeruginosa]HBO2950583.1 helix-turn-helix transcriptional regulator [Pseudomonas aeruginosa]HBO3018894.1 helix-turn-helix transcriptional regulator [Pseudomonas aeruginosa]HBO3916564.1 helix-turn-helix transcriptional regulator [Pseudomonas aeruginosa]